MDSTKLDRHIRKLCIKNLRSDRVKCCAECPFEDIIVEHRPDLAVLFEEKRDKQR